MQIDFVITELFPGGAERCLTELAIGLKRRRHRVRVFSLQPLPTDERRLLVRRLDDNLIQIATANSNRVTHLPRTVAALQEFWQTSDVQIVQTFLHHANVIGSVIAQRHTRAAIVGGVRVAQPKWFRSRLEALASSRMDAVVCVSEAVADFARTHLRVEDAKLRVIGNGVDPQRFESAAPLDLATLGWSPKAIVILFAGRLDPQKNLDAIFSAAPRWFDADPRRRLLFVGDGIERSRVETFCESIPDDRAKHIEWMPDVAGAMAAARVIVLPSHYEGMPNVALEAMASQRPIVCSAVQGTSELFPTDQDRRRFQVFEPGDQTTFTRLVENFCNDPDLADRIGSDNRRHVVQTASIDAMVDRYEDLYQQLCR